MDTFERPREDPLSLHGYLHCNLGPTKRIEPSGYTDFISIQAVTGIRLFLATHYARVSISAIYAAKAQFGHGDFVNLTYGRETAETLVDLVDFGMLAEGGVRAARGIPANGHKRSYFGDHNEDG